MNKLKIEWIRIRIFGLFVLALLIIKKQTNKYEEKWVILQSIGIYKSKETRVVTYTCRYSSEHLISIIQSRQDKLGIKY